MSLIVRPVAYDIQLPEPHFSPGLNAHELQLGREHAASHGGLLPDDAFWSFLKARHEINPVRFDRHHPRIAGLLDRDQEVRGLLSRQISTPAPPAPRQIPVAFPLVPPPAGLLGGGVISTSPGWPPTGPVPGTDPPVVSVPEPSSVVLLVTALVTVAVYGLLRSQLWFKERSPRRETLSSPWCGPTE